MKMIKNNLAPVEKPSSHYVAGRSFYQPAGASFIRRMDMLIIREEGESLENYKKRLISEVHYQRMSAEDAMDCYEEAWLKDGGR